MKQKVVQEVMKMQKEFAAQYVISIDLMLWLWKVYSHYQGNQQQYWKKKHF